MTNQPTAVDTTHLLLRNIQRRLTWIAWGTWIIAIPFAIGLAIWLLFVVLLGNALGG